MALWYKTDLFYHLRHREKQGRFCTMKKFAQFRHSCEIPYWAMQQQTRLQTFGWPNNRRHNSTVNRPATTRALSLVFFSTEICRPWYVCCCLVWSLLSPPVPPEQWITAPPAAANMHKTPGVWVWCEHPVCPNICRGLSQSWYKNPWLTDLLPPRLRWSMWERSLRRSGPGVV